MAPSHSKQGNNDVHHATTCPQKSYKGQEEAHKRRILRDHLFSGRLATLAKLYTGKALPVFESSHRLIRVTFDFFGKDVTLLMSAADPWTNTWLDRLKRLTKGMDYQFNIAGTVLSSIFSGLGLGAYLQQCFTNFVKSLSAATISIFLAAGILLKANDYFIQCQAMSLIVTNLGLSAHLIASLNWPFSLGRFFLQANTSEPFTWVPTGIAVLLCLVLGGTNAVQSLGIFQRSTNLGYTMATVVGLHRIMQESLKDLIPYVYKTITGRDWQVESLASNLSSFTEFVSAVEDFERNRLCDLELKWEAQLEVFELQTKYKDLLLEANRLGLGRSLTPIVANYWTKVSSWVKRVSSSGILLAGHRGEPISILISGKPGMGKSYMVNNLVRDIGAEHIPWGNIPNETIANHIYVRNPQENYWSGYRGQFCTLYDDFGQVADTESVPDPEYLEVIQAVGDNPYKIPMADIEEKNRGYFRSTMVVATTNLNRFAPTTVKSIRSPEALARRFDLHIEIVKHNNERAYQIKLDNDPKAIVSYEEIVNIMRGKLAEKLRKWQERSAEGQLRESPVEHKCIAHRLLFLSGPSSIEGTLLKRRAHNPENPDHRYCHPSLPCRMRAQSIWSWITGSNNSPIVWTQRSITLCDLLNDQSLYRFIQSDPQALSDLRDASEQLIHRCEQLDIEIETINLHGTILPTRNTILPHILLPEFRDIRNRTFTIRTSHVNAQALDDALLDNAADIPENLPVTLLIQRWATVILTKIRDVFSYGGGLLSHLASAISNLLFEHPSAYVGFILVSGILMRHAMDTITSMVIDGDVASCREDDKDPVRARIAKAYREKKTESDMKRESRDAVGGQRATKGRSLHMAPESRDTQGGQKSHKSRSMKLEMLHEYLGSVELLETSKYGLGSDDEYVHIRHDLMQAALDLGRLNVELHELLQAAFDQYADLFLFASQDGGLDLITLQPKLLETYRSAALRYGPEAVMNALDADERVKKMYARSQDINVFEAWVDTLPPTYKFQGSADQNADGIATAISTNLFDIRAAGAATYASHIFFYSARSAWCNKHTYELLKHSDFTITRYKKDGSPDSLTFKWSDIKLVAHPELDLVLLRFPITLSPLPNVEKHLFTDADLNFSILPACRLVTRRNGQILWLQSPAPFIIEKALEHDGIIVPASTAIGYTDMHTISGDCGAPLLAMDPTRQRKICGLHFLGNGFGSGQSVIITLDLIKSMEVAGGFEPELTPTYKLEACTVDTPINFPSGVVPTPFEPTKTKVRQSIIHGQVSEPTTAPAILRPIPGADPIMRAALQADRQRYIIPKTFIDELQTVLTRYTSGQTTLSRTLTLEEAIQGIGHLPPLDLSTSAGLPLCLETNGGKGKWITPDRQPTPEFRKMVEDFITGLENDKLVEPVLFKDTLKDERVKKHKADRTNPEKVKTRVFSAAPLVHTVVSRMYFGAFVSHAVKNSIRNTCTSGVNPHGPDWQMIVDYLQEVNNLTDDGDYETFDLTTPSGFMFATFLAIIKWYNINHRDPDSPQHQKDTKVRGHLADIACHPMHVVNGIVYITNGVLPSGLFGTTIINCGDNLCCFYYAWKKIYPMETAQSFLKNVRTVTHGDDVLFSVSPDFPDFTTANIGQALRTIGMNFTAADKSEFGSVARPIEGCQFLKRGFKKIAGIYRAPLERNSSLEMCNWVTKCPDLEQATVDNIETAMRELAISEDDTVWQEKLQKAIYQHTNGRRYLPIPTQADAIRDLFKHF